MGFTKARSNAGLLLAAFIFNWLNLRGMADENPVVPIQFWDASAKISHTVRLLAVLPDRIQQRLVSAFLSQWSRVKPEYLPEGDLRDTFNRLDNAFTRRQPTQADWDAGYQGRIQATVMNMNDDEARSLAEEIASFAYEVRRFAERYRYDRELRDQLSEEMRSILDATDTEQ